MVRIEDLRTGKIKLEFGNPDQIEAIRAEERRLEKLSEGPALCSTCDGEGVVECDDCDGTGKEN